MAYYYKIGEDGNKNVSSPEGIQIYEENSSACSSPCIKYDFSKHVLIELLDNVTPEAKLWTKLGLSRNKNIVHKRMIVDPHRVNCRRAIVVCDTAERAKELAQKLSQVKVLKRTICAVVIQTLLSDVCLFEKQIKQYGDKRSQHQFVYVTDLTRCHEPSGLAQYLREKFSPFGTILSIFVSEDKDGYAYPEGVIKFAHLSEAFAAELAYDQCAVAMERLSVTTHHNILLSQCDLRARLREAHSRQSLEFNSSVASESHVPFNESNLSRSTVVSSDSAKINDSINNDMRGADENSSFVENDTEFPSDSAEIADALKNTCESNFVNCLESIAECSDASKRASDDSAPFTETESYSIDKSACNVSSISSKSCTNKALTSRILGWITDLPNNNISAQMDITSNENNCTSENSVANNQSDQDDKSNHLLSTVISEDITSNASSYVTCKNVTSSFASDPSSGDVNHINDETLQLDKTSSRESICNEEKSDTNIEHLSTVLLTESTPKKEIENFSCTSLKRKPLSDFTQKLSLKGRKRNYSQSSSCLDGETTVKLPSISENVSCSVLLDSLPELNEFARNLTPKKSPVVFLEKLSASEIEEAMTKTDYEIPANTKKVSRLSQHELKNIMPDSSDRISLSSMSVKSLPVRRSSRLVSYGSEKLSSSLNASPLKNDAAEKASINFCDKKDDSNGIHDSPLRAWLKKELIVSTNNQVTKCQESTKSIVCATANKDVLISVGCSHMTCDFCYPDSMKLLLGFH
ncbi:uncharacterized protein TNCT_456051 [Trichonephila clavata]|uniref:Uncharacterized protein n=1 Tax=Trichonephila clavata TaxID=2740835 RepID=A0A8X6G2V6_TRICU|nr:uncharacterized protein TNCT_456051 [Trichonephila clavata]